VIGAGGHDTPAPRAGHADGLSRSPLLVSSIHFRCSRNVVKKVVERLLQALPYQWQHHKPIFRRLKQPPMPPGLPWNQELTQFPIHIRILGR
jgi:hypothetical protein